MQDTRRQFLRTTLLVAGLTATVGLGTWLSRPDGARVKLVPVEGERYSPGLLAFMADARFATPAEAVRAIRNQRVRFALEVA